MSAKTAPGAKKVGRPATGITRSKVSISLPTAYLQEAAKKASKSGESLSQFIARAVQNQLLQS
jgi:hypothetical protein